MKINAAIIGTGIGLKHLDALKNSNIAKVKYLCEKNKTKINYLKKKFPNINIIKNEDIIFKDPNINLVSIASYDDYHYDQIIKAIKSNKNIFVEKPLCLKFSQLKKIKKLLKRKKLFISSNLVLRVNSLFNDIKKKINRDKIFYIEMDYIWGRKYKFNGWRSNTKNYNFTLGAAVHIFDLIIWLLGEKPKTIKSYGNNISTKNTKFKNNSLLVYILKFSNNLIVKVSANGGAIYEHYHELKIFQTDKTFLHSKLGSKIFKQRENILKQYDLSNGYPDKLNRKKLLQDFIKSIRNRKHRHIVPEQDIYDTMSICFAAERSLKKSKEVKIVYI